MKTFHMFLLIAGFLIPDTPWRLCISPPMMNSVELAWLKAREECCLPSWLHQRVTQGCSLPDHLPLYRPHLAAERACSWVNSRRDSSSPLIKLESLCLLCSSPHPPADTHCLGSPREALTVRLIATSLLSML